MQTSDRLSTRPIKQCAFFLSFLAVGALQAHILEVKGLAVDPGLRRGDPVGDLSALGAGRHQITDLFAIPQGREPLRRASFEFGLRNQIAMNVEIMPSVLADSPVKTRARQVESFRQSFLFDDLIPARQISLVVFRIFAAHVCS